MSEKQKWMAIDDLVFEIGKAAYEYERTTKLEAVVGATLPSELVETEENDRVELPITIADVYMGQQREGACHMPLRIMDTETDVGVETLSLTPDEKKWLAENGEKYSVDLETGVLVLRNDPLRVVLPKCLIPRILRSAHDAALHRSAEIVINQLEPIVYWPMMKRDIRNYVKKCNVCSMSRKHADSTRRVLRIRPPTAHHTIAVDIVDVVFKDPVVVVTITDIFSRYTMFVSIVDTSTGILIEEAFNKWLEVFPAPKRCIMDNGSNFVSEKAEKYWEQRGVHMSKVAPYHSGGNGAAENSNKRLIRGLLVSTLEAHMKKYPKRHWTECISEVQQIYNDQPILGTQITPNMAQTGAPQSNMCRVLEHKISNAGEDDDISALLEQKQWFDEIAFNIRRLDAEMKIDYKPVSFVTINKGQYVWVKVKRGDTDYRKMAPKYAGPYEVIERVSPGTLLVRIIFDENEDGQICYEDRRVSIHHALLYRGELDNVSQVERGMRDYFIWLEEDGPLRGGGSSDKNDGEWLPSVGKGHQTEKKSVRTKEEKGSRRTVAKHLLTVSDDVTNRSELSVRLLEEEEAATSVDEPSGKRRRKRNIYMGFEQELPDIFGERVSSRGDRKVRFAVDEKEMKEKRK